MAKPRRPGTTRTTRAKTGAKLKSGTSGTDAIEDAEVVEAPADGAEASGKTDDTADDAAGDDTKPTDAAAEDAGPDAPGKTDAKPDADKPGDESAAEAAAVILGAPPEGDAGKDAKGDKGESPGAEAVVTPPEDVRETKDDHRERAMPTALPQPIAAAPPSARGGVMPLILGGIIAAVIGAGVLYISNEQGWISLGGDAELAATVATQNDEIDALQAALQSAQAEIETLKGVDTVIAGINEKITDLSTVVDGLSQATVTLGGGLEDTNKRLAEVATQPIPEARLPEKVTNAYEAKFAEFAKALQAEQDAKLAAIEKQMTTGLANMEALQEVARQAEQAAMDATREAKARTALAGIEVALDTGTSFGPALETLGKSGDWAVPGALVDAADGSTPTLAQLQSEFPAAARAALVASTRASAQDGSVGRFTAFFRTQLGARSLEPRDGDDPDAVLSRAEAAVSGGDLKAALAEIETLPEAGQAALADWKARAETRITVQAALAALADQLNSN